MAVDHLRFNPYTLGLSARGVRISDRSGKAIFASADEFYLNLRVASLFRRAFVFGRVRVEKPYLMIVRSKDGSYNFQDLFEGRGGGTRLSLNNIRITNGSADFRDDLKGVTHTVRDMMINVPFLSNIPYYADVYIHPLFSAAIDGASYEIKGRTKPFARSLETEIRIVAENVDLPGYASYLPPSAGIRVLRGFLNLDLAVRYSQYAAKEPSLILSGDVSLEKILVHSSGNEPLVELPRLAATFLPSDMLSRNMRLGRLVLTGPVLNVSRDAAGRVNLPFAVPPGTACGAERPGEGKGEARETTRARRMRLAIDQADVSKGKIIFTDDYPGSPFGTVLDSLNVRLDHFDTLGNEGAHFSFSANTDAEEQLRAEGTLSLPPLKVKGQATMRSLAIDRYSPYYQDRLPFLVEGGRMNLSFRYHFEPSGNERAVRASAVDLAVSNIAFKEPGTSNPFLTVPILSVSKADLDISRRRLTIEAMSTDKGLLRLSRSKSGQVNVLRVMGALGKKSGRAGPGTERQGAHWAVDIRQARVRGYTVSLRNEGSPGGASSVQMKDLDLRADGLSTERGAAARIQLSSVVGDDGTLAATGSIAIDPVSVDVQTSMKNVGLSSFRLYMPKSVNLSIEGGTVSSEGGLSVQAGPGGPTIIYSGTLSTADFAFTDTITGNTFLTWKSLSAGSFSAGYNPFFLKAERLALTDYYVRVALGQDGTFNIQHIIEGSRTSPAPSAGRKKGRWSGQSCPVLIVGPVSLQSGTIDFADHFVRPPYSARLTRMNGTMSAISSETKEPASIEIGGQINSYAPLRVAGEVSLFGPSASLELTASVSDLDLTSLSPYSARYVGYVIKRGTFTLDATYLVANGKLRANNRIGLDQLQLGDQVEGTPVIQLPIKLALSVLRDREDNISVDIPVSGDLSNPRFSFAGVRRKGSRYWSRPP